MAAAPGSLSYNAFLALPPEQRTSNRWAELSHSNRRRLVEEGKARLAPKPAMAFPREQAMFGMGIGERANANYNRYKALKNLEKSHVRPLSVAEVEEIGSLEKRYPDFPRQLWTLNDWLRELVERDRAERQARAPGATLQQLVPGRRSPLPGGAAGGAAAGGRGSPLSSAGRGSPLPPGVAMFDPTVPPPPGYTALELGEVGPAASAPSSTSRPRLESAAIAGNGAGGAAAAPSPLPGASISPGAKKQPSVLNKAKELLGIFKKPEDPEEGGGPAGGEGGTFGGGRKRRGRKSKKYTKKYTKKSKKSRRRN